MVNNIKEDSSNHMIQMENNDIITSSQNEINSDSNFHNSDKSFITNNITADFSEVLRNIPNFQKGVISSSNPMPNFSPLFLGLTPKSFPTPAESKATINQNESLQKLSEPLPLSDFNNVNLFGNFSSSLSASSDFNSTIAPSTTNFQNMLFHSQSMPPPLPQRSLSGIQNIPSSQYTIPSKMQSTSSTLIRQQSQNEIDAQRRLKNRERVRKCRKKKQDRLTYLETRNIELEQENTNLKIKSRRLDETGLSDELTEIELNMLRTKQIESLCILENLLNFASLQNSREKISSMASSIWDENIHVIYGISGAKTSNIHDAINDTMLLGNIFKECNFKRVNMTRMNETKLSVLWEVTAILKVPTIKEDDISSVKEKMDLLPFYVISSVIGERKLAFNVNSIISFNMEKICEDIRVLDILSLFYEILPMLDNRSDILSTLIQNISKSQSMILNY